MKTVDTHGTFEDVIAGSSDHVRRIAARLRLLICDVYPDVVEVPWPRQRISGYGVGPKKMSEHFCYIGLQRDRVNLGFYHGAVLPDPSDLLGGTGKRLRHVKVSDEAEVEGPSIRALIEASVREREQTLHSEGRV